jgi:hypothetical protein
VHSKVVIIREKLEVFLAIYVSKRCLLMLIRFYQRIQGRVTSVGLCAESLETLSLYLIGADSKDIFVAFLRIIMHIRNK